MEDMNLTALMQGIVLRCNKSLAKTGSFIQLSLPSHLTNFFWHDRSLEKLLKRLVCQASLAVDRGAPIRIAVRQKAKMRGLEKFFQVYPSHWIQLKITQRGPLGLEPGAREVLEDSGFRCDEWIGAKESWPQLGFFSSGTKPLLKLACYLQRRRITQTCELLIPVMTPASPTTALQRAVQSKVVRFPRPNLPINSKNPGRSRRIYQRTAETN